MNKAPLCNNTNYILLLRRTGVEVLSDADKYSQAKYTTC